MSHEKTTCQTKIPLKIKKMTMELCDLRMTVQVGQHYVCRVSVHLSQWLSTCR